VLAGVLGGGPFVVAGVWRDYVRQTGAVMIGQADYLRLTGDRRINDAQLWLAPDASEQDVQAACARWCARGRRAGPGGVRLGRQVRAISLRIFDRSFAVTYWLQAVAIAIGLFGVAASFSAQVLARRKEFGLLAHLGLTRRQILAVVAGEGAAWTVIGALAGLALGWRWPWCWCTWSTRKASTGPWTCCCPGRGCSCCARRRGGGHRHGLAGRRAAAAATRCSRSRKMVSARERSLVQGPAGAQDHAWT
jgi:hypothetical protein